MFSHCRKKRVTGLRAAVFLLVLFFCANGRAQNEPPDLTAAQVTPDEGLAPLEITLDASACTDPDGDALTFTWTITSDATATVVLEGDYHQHTLQAVGEYNVTLRATDDATVSASTEKIFSITAHQVEPWQVPDDGCACRAVGRHGGGGRRGAGGFILLFFCALVCVRAAGRGIRWTRPGRLWHTRRGRLPSPPLRPGRRHRIRAGRICGHPARPGRSGLCRTAG